MAFPVPEATDVPANITLGRSRSLRPGRIDASAVFRAATASPVSEALLTRSPYSSTTRASAGMLSPSARINKSPGTTSLAGICTSVPSRIICAYDGRRCRNFSMACSARCSRQYEKALLAMAKSRIISARVQSLCQRLIMAASTIRRLNGCRI